jgi:hypothetical protein
VDVVAVVSGSQYGTAQDLTFIIPIGTLAIFCLWAFFQRIPGTARDRDESLVTREELERRE